MTGQITTETVLLVDGVGNAVPTALQLPTTRFIKLPLVQRGIEVKFERTEEFHEGLRLFRQMHAGVPAVRCIRQKAA